MKKNKSMENKVFNIRLTQVNMTSQEIFTYLLELYLDMLDELILNEKSFSRWRILFDHREEYILKENLRNIQAILLRDLHNKTPHRLCFKKLTTPLQKIFICLFYNLEEDLIITSPEGVRDLWDDLLDISTDNSKQFSITLNLTRQWMKDYQTDGLEES